MMSVIISKIIWLSTHVVLKLESSREAEVTSSVKVIAPRHGYDSIPILPPTSSPGHPLPAMQRLHSRSAVFCVSGERLPNFVFALSFSSHKFVVIL